MPILTKENWSNYINYKADFRIRNIIRDNEGQHIMIKR